MTIPPALRELEELCGRQTPLDVYHGAVRRAAQCVGGVQGFGAMLATCSDEFQGEIRGAFERDVARPLMAPRTVGSRRTFAVSNLGGRVEPGALKLADEHFTTHDGTTKLLLVELTGHCGVLPAPGGRAYGKLDRFGRVSDCCGALALLLANPAGAAAVRHPWFDQLSSFFGTERLELLRGDGSQKAMLTAAIVHAVLQGETAIADLVREPPPTPTHVLLAAAVVLNQPGVDEVIPVGLHHLRSDGRELHVVHGVSLRSSPGALRYEEYGGRLRVASDELVESSDEGRALPEARAEVARALRPFHSAHDELTRARAALVRERVESARAQVRRIERKPEAWRVYARPLLRGVVQGLSLIAPGSASRPC
jgi:hypothetical protein